MDLKVFNVVLSLMIQAGHMGDLSGEQKKQFVMNGMKDILPWDDELEELVLVIMDIIIDVEKGRLKINDRFGVGCC